MRCLIVEDEAARVEAILPDFVKIFGKEAIDLAADRDEAIEKITRIPYDLVVLDQRIPSRAGENDPDTIHGRAVLEHIQNVATDTPVYFLTGLPMEEEYIDQLLSQGRQCDVFGDRKAFTLVERFRKSTLTPFFAAVEALAKTARETNQIEISSTGQELNLKTEHFKILRVFGRLHSGDCVHVEAINGGFSSARVLKIDVKDTKGEVRMSAVGKLDEFRKVVREIECFEREISRLPAGTYAPLLPPPQPRILGHGGAFYRLLEGYDRTLFQVLNAGDQAAAQCVEGLRIAEESWSKKPEGRKIKISELCKLLVWEDRIPTIHAMIGEDFDWKSYEDKEIGINLCTRHGDLHGENARANSQQRVMLLDYGAVGPLPSAIDAVTLELSPFFHPHGNRSLLKWQPSDGALPWSDRASFAARTACPLFVEATRNWAHAHSYGDREVLACAYAYVLRQLQFEKPDVELARAILVDVVSKGLSN